MIKKCFFLLILFLVMFFPSCSVIEDIVGNGYDWPVGDIVMVTPFVYAAEILSINEAYSTHSSCPWGFAHRGIDFMISSDHVAFQAVSSGVVMSIDKFLNTGNGFWQVNVVVKYNSTFEVNYAFEPFTSTEAGGNIQLSYIQVSEGDEVVQGSVIGYLHYEKPGAHVHFDLFRDGQSICPENYFTGSAAQEILNILHQTFPGANMCYE